MPVSEQRVSGIESTMAELARAQIRTELALDRLAESQAKTEQELREFKAEMAESRRRSEAEMAESRRRSESEMAESRRRSESEMAESRRRSETGMAEFRAEMADAYRRSDESMAKFKAEMAELHRRSDERMAEFKREAEADRKRMDKAWGELANRLGTLLEDIVAPNVERIAEEELGVGPLVRLVCRYRRRQSPGRWSEWDVLAVGHEAVVSCEVRSQLTLTDIPSLLEKFARFADAFPEHAHLRLIKIAASWAIEDAALKELTRQRIYALAMSDDTMRLLNRDAI